MIGEIDRHDPLLDALVPFDAQLEVLAEGFEWTEGPVWVADGGYLLFSDIPPNSIYRWQQGAGHELWLTPSGYTGSAPRGGEPGSNALLLDPEDRLVLCQHGDRRMARMEATLEEPRPDFTTLADRWDGKRFNSPNDAVFHSSGALYFTDPPYGLAAGPEDPTREIDFEGVFRLAPDGTVSLLTSELARPNGIAFSPDEKTLYVSNSDPIHAVWMAYEVLSDGSLGDGRAFFDATQWVGKSPGLPDGMKVDVHGNVFASGPGGILVFSSRGEHLGTLVTTLATSNCAFGDDGSTLYITAHTHLLGIRLATRGLGF
jgi:gluconolactonase